MLSLDYYRTAKVVIEDSSSYLLKNTLLVLKLGINLISARHLCKDRLKGILMLRIYTLRKIIKYLSTHSRTTAFTS